LLPRRHNRRPPHHDPIRLRFSRESQIPSEAPLRESCLAVLLAHWGDASQGRILSKLLTRLAEAERPLAGVVTWLRLTAYPVLAVIYAGGIAALAAEQYHMLRVCLTTPVRRDRSRNEEATPILLSVVAEVTAIFNAFKALPGMAQKYVPRS
jgi:hypothetical protein